MIKIISIAGLPCCGKTTLCNKIASSYNGISLDLEYLRTLFFEENFNNNLFKFTHNEPIKENEDLRMYFLRCVIYDNIISLEEYIEWYKVIMNFMNEKIIKILKDFDSLNYKEFLIKYNKIIKYSTFNKPNLIVLNHALLPLTDIWKKSTISIMLTGGESLLVTRFIKRENLNFNEDLKVDILRHMKLYSILNSDAKSDIIYDTTNNFMDIKQINKICKERGINMKPEVKFKTKDYNYYNRAIGIIKKNDKFLILNVDNSAYYHIPGGHIEIAEDSLAAVSREIKEELDYTVKNATLFCIQENFYEKKGIPQHGVEYYYLIETEENIETLDREVIENDRGEEKHLLIRWVTTNQLKQIDLRPFTVKDLMVNNKLNELTHIIQRD